MFRLTKRFLILVVIFANPLVFLSTQVWARDWFVDNHASGRSDGTSWEDAWPSLRRINWEVIRPGDTINISGGSDSKTYRADSLDIASGHKVSDVVIRSGQDPGHTGKVILDGDNALEQTVKIRDSDSVSNLTFTGNFEGKQNLRITGGQYYGIYVQGGRDSQSQGIILEYLEIDNNGMNGIRWDYHGKGGNEVRFCKIHDNDKSKRGSAQFTTSYLDDPGTYDTLKIHHNEVYNIRDDGIAVRNGGVSVYSNKVHSALRWDGVGDPHRDLIDVAAEKWVKVYNNEVFDLLIDSKSNAYIFIQPFGEDDMLIEHIRVFNNLIYETRDKPLDPPSYARGISFKLEALCTEVNDVLIEHNTVVDTEVWGLTLTLNGLDSQYVNDVIIKNNIFFNNALGGKEGGWRTVFVIGRESEEGNWTVGSEGSKADVVLDYNVVGVANKDVMNVSHKGKFYDFDTWKESFSVEQNGFYGDPQFRSWAERGDENDFRLKSVSPVIDRASALSDVDMDYEGTPRPQGLGHDPGAFEF